MSAIFARPASRRFDGQLLPQGQDPVRAQYEAYPYAARDAGEEARRLIQGSPSHILEIDHYVYAGRRDCRLPFRALIAGGGTGDGAIMLAQHLADRLGPAEVLFLGLSSASLAIPQPRSKAPRLSFISFHIRPISILQRSPLPLYH